ncbi:sensor histidine kinase [Brevundimonas goettingensis]|uniref:sensor histidine kinase n=1 Tax=Brevundimonas goettingensis TaxID=2774190 RepID=UPI0021F23CDF|nr:HAMP domain-containing sensor histidine kinase [Brevundimonas goettingensis]
MHATPGALTIGVRQEGDRAVLQVMDAGPGLPPGFEGRAFNPFQRHGRAASGTGLGLAVVRAIAEAHGGRALHRTRPRGGSIFEIDIPIVSGAGD